MTLILDGNFLVDANDRDRVAPNFRAGEFRRPNGVLRVHQELINAVQALRLRLGRSIRIIDMRSRTVANQQRSGLFAVIDSANRPALLEHAQHLLTQGLLKKVTRVEDGVRVDIGNPARPTPVTPLMGLQTAVQVTAGFETQGDPYQQVTGNFDGAGLSFGPAQFNFGTNTLVPLFRRFITADEAALNACFTKPAHYSEWRETLERPRRQRVAWADAHSTANKRTLVQPWRGYLQSVGRVPAFRNIMTEHAITKYGGKLARALQWLHGEHGIEIDNLLCICSLYDLCTQQGSLNKAHSAIRERFRDDPPDNQFELVRVAVEERGLTANERWRADCVSRRLGILNRQPTAYAAFGHRSKRSNRNFSLLRNVPVSHAEQLRLGQVSVE